MLSLVGGGLPLQISWISAPILLLCEKEFLLFLVYAFKIKVSNLELSKSHLTFPNIPQPLFLAPPAQRRSDQFANVKLCHAKSPKFLTGGPGL